VNRRPRLTSALLHLSLAACAAGEGFAAVEREHLVVFLAANPVAATYLGGSAVDPSLAKIDGRLRDWSEPALAAEARHLEGLRARIAAFPAASLTPAQRIDRAVMLSQIDFLLREQRDRKVWRRILDTYASEPFRGVDWHLLGMPDLGGGRMGTRADWERVDERVRAIPAYLATARANLEKGIAAGDPPDPRMILREGLHAAATSARYFAEELPGIAAERTRGEPFSAALVADLRRDGAKAAEAFRRFRAFLVDAFVESEAGGKATLKPAFRGDRYAVGADEYSWRVRNVLQVEEPIDSMYARSARLVADERARLSGLARRAAERRGLALAWGTEAETAASTRQVFSALGRDYPKSDAERTAWMNEATARLVAYARKNAMFEIPADYRVEIVQTPPVLEKSLDGGSYFPAPPFKPSGAGHFYWNPTHGDVEMLKQSNRSSLADLAAHELFPGHDYHFKVMTSNRASISPVRWLLPGEVEGSASMWADSMAVEGWAHYGEALMAEAGPGAPDGAYVGDEILYESQGALYRNLRVRIDIGLHTGRISFADAVDLFSETVDFLPGSCRTPSLPAEKAASCTSAESAIYRYSKWPTQAITYRLGKERIQALRAEVPSGAEAGATRRLHELLMKQGPIPPDLVRAAVLADLAGAASP
jgi:uncharacterized protein (DUF885 family)